MIPISLDRLLGCRSTLMLQGPMSPFFANLARTLRAHGQQVWKVNFNAGDDHFYRGPGVTAFRDPLNEWPERVRELMLHKQVDALVLFGQTRVMHEMAIREARALGLKVFVFEEGYMRPDYVTLELGGVNAESSLSRDPAFYKALDTEPMPDPRPTGQHFNLVADLAMTYAWALWRGRSDYPHYRHHRDLGPVTEGLRWVRSGYRKWRYGWLEKPIAAFLLEPEQHKRYFLVPLQVHNDSQIVHHSPFGSVANFIEHVLASFASDALPDQLLVFKHHPLDRPYKDYTEQLRDASARLGLSGRVFYVHDLHLPSLIQHARGVVTVNSTTGLQSMFHGTPVIALGDCFYAVPGMVHAGPLARFWTEPGEVDQDLFRRFRAHVIRETQLNASFYADTPGLPSITETKLRRASASLTPIEADQADTWSNPTVPTLK